MFHAFGHADVFKFRIVLSHEALHLPECHAADGRTGTFFVILDQAMRENKDVFLSSFFSLSDFLSSFLTFADAF